MTIPPVLLSVEVGLAPDEAFEHFTAEMGQWWPIETHSLSEKRTKSCGIDPHLGGQVYEVDGDGIRQIWGTVTRWDPPRVVAFTWHVGREADTAQNVEVRFSPTTRGTHVELEHSGWERLGDEALETREGYANGWAFVFGTRFVESAQKKVASR